MLRCSSIIATSAEARARAAFPILFHHAHCTRKGGMLALAW